jgi:hypothetical protein
VKPPELPLLHTLRSYGLDDLRHDATAAAVRLTLLVPAALGYAEVAGLPAVTGLYATMARLLCAQRRDARRSPAFRHRAARRPDGPKAFCFEPKASTGEKADR